MGAGAVRGASIRNCLLLFPFFIMVLGSTVLFVIQVTIVHMSSLKAVEAGRVTVSRLPTRGRPWSSRGIRFALLASTNRYSRRDFRCSVELVAR